MRARVVLTVVIAALAAAPTALAAFPGKNGTIAFIKSKHGNPDIWVMGPKGGKETDISRSPKAFESAPVFSPNGRTIAFLWSNRSGSRNGIGIVNSNGKGLRHLTNIANSQEFYERPGFTPDGQTIVFTCGHNDASGEPVFAICSMPASGGAQKQLFGGAGLPRNAITSPVGPQVVFLVIDPNGQGEDILDVSALDGSNAVPIGGVTPMSDWSPDGRSFVYEDHLAVTTRAADGSGTPTHIADRPMRDDDPSFSPDGRLVIWENEATHDLWIANSTGGGLKNMTHQPGFEKQPTWGRAVKGKH